MNRFTVSRLANLLRKEMVETFRDWKMLSLTLTFAPFFVLLMYAYLGHASPIYHVAVVNGDPGMELATGLVQALAAVRSEDRTL